ncbi:cytochrome P450 [Penicillium herquei]|nr:cytochrome P450 [Penicillium herquei]
MEFEILRSHPFLALTAGWLLHQLGVVIYRLFFHPLAKFPGPKITAATGWFETYHDLFRRGMFVWEIEKMHQQYGSIVRINPDEIHIIDSQYYDTIYAGGTNKRHKYANSAILTGSPTSTVGTLNHGQHRLRRGAISPFFSRRAILQQEPLILEKIDRLCARLTDSMATNTVIRLDVAFMAMTMDIITKYAYGQSSNYLDDDDFRLLWKEAFAGAMENGILLRNFPYMLPILKAIPLPVLRILSPNAASLKDWGNLVAGYVAGMLAGKGDEKVKGTVFQTMLDSDLPHEEKSAQRLLDEGQAVVGAGSETTAGALTVISFHILNDKRILQKLRDELKPLSPGQERVWSKLEQLPYLTGVVNEGLRLSIGSMMRLPRIANEPLRYKQWEIPAGTPISESTYFVHHDTSIFPDPEHFRPERWIEAKESGSRLDRYLTCFSKGNRACAGINMAYAELYLTIAIVMTRFEMELFETTIDDVKPERDWTIPVPKLDSKGVRIKVTATLG